MFICLLVKLALNLPEERSGSMGESSAAAGRYLSYRAASTGTDLPAFSLLPSVNQKLIFVLGSFVKSELMVQFVPSGAELRKRSFSGNGLPVVLSHVTMSLSVCS